MRNLLRSVPLLLFGLILMTDVSICRAKIVSVLNFGVVNDGKTQCRQGIQKAIDSCYDSGGGTVYFPTGDYLCGTIYLKDNIILKLEAGATIWGSRKIEDYDDINVCYSDVKPHFLFYGNEVKNVTIEGQGTINGNGDAFWATDLKPVRPKTIHMRKSSNITIKDITIRDSACYNVWLLGCDNVNIDGISIINPHDSPNTDGLDIDCSSNVRISNCYIDTGDDAIALKSDSYRLCENKACEKITVTNCNLRTSCCAIRVAYEGDSPIRDCTFSNLTIFDTDIGIDIISILPEEGSFGVKIDEGAKIERLNFSDIVMDKVNYPIYMWLGKAREGEHKGFIKDISINNVTAYGRNGSYIGGMSNKKIENVLLNNINLILYGKQWLKEADATSWRPGWSGWVPIPHAVYAHDVDGLVMNNVNVRWDSTADGAWRSAIACQNVTGLEMLGFRGRNFNEKYPAIELTNVSNAYIHNCNPQNGTGTFVGIKGENNEKIVIDDNNTINVKEKIKLSSEVNKDVLVDDD